MSGRDNNVRTSGVLGDLRGASVGRRGAQLDRRRQAQADRDRLVALAERRRAVRIFKN